MKKNNKGFSLVELIIVIAIMAVLLGLLAPQFIKYVEQSRRSKDIQNADMLREAFLADIADAHTTGSNTIQVTYSNTAQLPDTINEVPLTAGNVCGRGLTFTATYDVDSNTVSIYPTGHPSYNLASITGASAYKNA